VKRMSGDTIGVAGGASQNWITFILMIVVGALALVSLYMGFQAYGSNQMDMAFIWLGVGAAGFVAIGYSFFRSKPPVKESIDPNKQAEVITTLECPQCNLKRVRAFQRGDYIFKNDEPCTRCEGNMVITRIHTRKEGKKA
jgi:rubredoxin